MTIQPFVIPGVSLPVSNQERTHAEARTHLDINPVASIRVDPQVASALIEINRIAGLIGKWNIKIYRRDEFGLHVIRGRGMEYGADRWWTAPDGIEKVTISDSEVYLDTEMDYCVVQEMPQDPLKRPVIQRNMVTIPSFESTTSAGLVLAPGSTSTNGSIGISGANEQQKWSWYKRVGSITHTSGDLPSSRPVFRTTDAFVTMTLISTYDPLGPAGPNNEHKAYALTVKPTERGDRTIAVSTVENIIANKGYDVTVYGRALSGDRNFRVVVECLDTASSVLDTQAAPYVNLSSGDWHASSLAFVPPVGTSQVRVKAEFQHVAGSLSPEHDLLWVSQAPLIEPGQTIKYDHNDVSPRVTASVDPTGGSLTGSGAILLVPDQGNTGPIVLGCGTSRNLVAANRKYSVTSFVREVSADRTAVLTVKAYDVNNQLLLTQDGPTTHLSGGGQSNVAECTFFSPAGVSYITVHLTLSPTPSAITPDNDRIYVDIDTIVRIEDNPNSRYGVNGLMLGGTTQAARTYTDPVTNVSTNLYHLANIPQWNTARGSGFSTNDLRYIVSGDIRCHNPGVVGVLATWLNTKTFDPTWTWRNSETTHPGQTWKDLQALHYFPDFSAHIYLAERNAVGDPVPGTLVDLGLVGDQWFRFSQEVTPIMGGSLGYALYTSTHTGPSTPDPHLPPPGDSAVLGWVLDGFMIDTAPRHYYGLPFLDASMDSSTRWSGIHSNPGVINPATGMEVTDNWRILWEGKENGSSSVLVPPRYWYICNGPYVVPSAYGEAKFGCVVVHMVDPVLPIRNTWAVLMEIDSWDHAARLERYPVVSRRTPVPVNDLRMAKAGQLTVLTKTLDERNAMLEMLSSGRVLLIQFPRTRSWGETNLYAAVDNVTEEYIGPDRTRSERRWVLPIQKVDRPSGMISTALYATWFSVTSSRDWGNWAQLTMQRARWSDVVYDVPSNTRYTVRDPLRISGSQQAAAAVAAFGALNAPSAMSGVTVPSSAALYQKTPLGTATTILQGSPTTGPKAP